MPQINAPRNTPVNAISPETLVNCIRVLTMDAVQKAHSGHPGMPMGMADVAYVLFSKFLKFNPNHPTWADRDRFILSAGHGSLLLYILNYLTGYKGITLEEIKHFRQWGYHTAGHPEMNHELGIETTTGPLGQGLANAVGFALAEKMLKADFGEKLVNHKTYVLVGDGCVAEGLSQEAISFAGHLALNNLIVLWDDNRITIDGSTDLSTSDDQCKRFEACGWFAQCIDGHDHKQIEAALTAAQHSQKPSLIACKTIIGFGSPHKAGTASCHGSPLGEEEVALTRAQLKWDAPAFEIPSPLLEEWRRMGRRHEGLYQEWIHRLETTDPEIQKNFRDRLEGNFSSSWKQPLEKAIKEIISEGYAEATRVLSQKILDIIAPCLPELVGGSADLTSSTNTKAKSMQSITRDNFKGRYIHYGIREHAMAGIMNGIALHGGFIPYGGTFLVFSDYARPSMRLSALMKQRVIYVMTHDSIGLGEDGPTHQPIEHLASLRAIPHMHVFRPADLVETAESWILALSMKNTPSVLALTRQKIPLVRRDSKENLTARGAYILKPAPGKRQVTLIATGSEVHIALKAQDLLNNENISACVVSMPCQELFDTQPKEYQEEVLGSVLRVAIEAAHPMSWYKYVGLEGLIVGLESFGASAPYEELYKNFGLTAENIVKRIKEKLT